MDEEFIDSQTYTKEFIEIASSIGFILSDENNYEVNQCHELYKLASHPHSERVLGNRIAMGIISILIRKKYVPCVPIDSIRHYSGYEDIDKEIQLLENLRFIKEYTLIEGQEENLNIVKHAESVLSSIKLVEKLLDENDSIKSEELKSILETLDSPSETVFCLTEDELINCMKQAIETGSVLNVDTISKSSKLEEGDYGYRMNENSAFIQNVAKLSIKLIDEIEYIHSNYM